MSKNSIGKNNSFKKKIRNFSAEISPTGEEEANLLLAENGDILTTEAGDEIATEP
jgi:hypothetical protein